VSNNVGMPSRLRALLTAFALVAIVIGAQLPAAASQPPGFDLRAHRGGRRGGAR
jgi:uncharacterized membrane protein